MCQKTARADSPTLALGDEGIRICSAKRIVKKGKAGERVLGKGGASLRKQTLTKNRPAGVRRASGSRQEDGGSSSAAERTTAQFREGKKKKH